MYSKCTICLESTTVDNSASLFCGHIFHRQCIDDLIGSEKKKNATKKSYACPLCKKVFTEARVTRLYPIPPSSSPARPSSPLSFVEGDDSDEDVPTDDKQRKSAIDQKNLRLKKLVTNPVDTACAEEMAKEVRALGCLFGGSTNIDLGVKTSITQFLTIVQELIVDRLIPILTELDLQKEGNSELSDEIDTLSEKLDQKEKDIKEQVEKHKKQIAGMVQSHEKRVKELQSQAKQKESQQKDLTGNYHNLFKEHKELKAKYGESQSRCLKSEEEHERYRTMLSDLKNSNKKLSEAVARLQQDNAQLHAEQSQYQERPMPDMSHSSPEPVFSDDTFEDTAFASTKTEAITARKEDHMKEMSWATKKRKPVPLTTPKPKPSKMPRTESNVGPIQLVNGKVNKAVYIGSRRSGIN